MLSTTRRTSRPASAAMTFSVSVPVPSALRTPRARAIATRAPLGTATASSRAKATSRPEAAASSAISIASRDLPIPPGPTSVTSRTPSLTEKLRDLGALPIASDNGRVRRGDLWCSSAAGFDALRRHVRRRNARREAWRDLTDQVRELVGRREGLLRTPIVVADAVEEPVQPVIALRGRFLHVDEARELGRQTVFVFEALTSLPRVRPSRSSRRRCPRTRRSVRDRTDRDRAGRMRPGAEFEHDRRSRSCSIAARTAMRSGSSSLSVELTKTRMRWSGSADHRGPFRHREIIRHRGTRGRPAHLDLHVQHAGVRIRVRVAWGSDGHTPLASHSPPGLTIE